MTTMKPAVNGNADPEMMAIAQAAAEWRARHDAGLAPPGERQFIRWLEADERHAKLFSQMDTTWAMLDRAREVPAEALGMPAPSATSPAKPTSRLPRWAWVAAGLAAAAAVALL